MKTVVGLFETFDDAKSTLGDFARLGLSAKQIGLLSPAPVSGAKAVAPDMSLLDLPGLGRVAANSPMLQLLDAPSAQRTPDGALGALLRIGVPRSEATRFVDGIKRGGTLEALVIEDDKAAEALAIMSRHTGNGASRLRQAEADIVIPIVREELSVGKTEIDNGGVRVVTHVTARPVEATVSVREEHINIERRIVDRPVSAADDAFRDRVAEMKASNEEPLVTKRAHVVEEIRVHKGSSERVERVHDTLRQTDVDISELPVGTSGHDLPAREFGRELARRSPGSEWSKIEAKAKSMWEGKNPGTWERFREAIRAGWHSMTH